MKCVFLLHLLEQDYVLQIWKREARFFPRLTWRLLNRSLSRRMPIGWPIGRFRIDLPGGTRVRGKALSTWLRPREILQDQRMALDRIKRACEISRRWGADVVGLGGLNGVVGMRGAAVRDEVDVAVTTGNHLVVPVAVDAVEAVLGALEAKIADEEIVVVGFPGIHAPHIARLLVRRGAGRLTLVTRGVSAKVRRLVSELEGGGETRVRLVTDLGEGLRSGRTVVSATATGGTIRQRDLLPGTCVINANVVGDVVGPSAERDDVLSLDGGLVELPDDARVKGNLFGLDGRIIYVCLAEVILSGLERPGESFSVGRRIDPDKVETMERLTRKYGMKPAPFRSFKQPVSLEAIARIRAIRRAVSG